MSEASRELRTLRDLMRFAVSRFNEAGVFFGHGSDNAWDEAAYLLLHCLHLPLDRLEPFLDARLTRSERTQCVQLIARRIGERLPAAYLTNEAWLGEYRFYVDRRVIVPRSFIGELLRERLTPWIAEPDEITSVLDLCTGSACLAIIAAHVFPAALVDAVDVSADALAVARRNVTDHALDERVRLIESDLFAGLRGRRYDLIVSNPPYVDAATMATLPAEYRCEPELALASGVDGLDLTRAIIAQARRHLAPHGLLVVEIGHNRDTLEAAFPDLPFTWLETSAGDRYVFLLQHQDLPQ
ncbi:50S ribosomal protein L3 N(5)-glutamine methyltransferase [Accumulibacter sp.]|uniref:50S ribosomal protein L3 N(5)-glutamine methyltransferase n=1 Tax=Accumulibacter sp. TaxID=2053492 RepID=UPI002CE9DA0F|nr:50S ribosomal protein L3 N(5)-glutamine methyltransferase [Accumulibacter sp.]HNG87832.1 50S ribosomal protein L3 N(5)-glutamine methyltransferase [Accumulibacter sp.]